MTSSSKIWYDNEHCSLETHQYGNAEMSKAGTILTSFQPEQELDCNTKHIVPKLDEHDIDSSLSEEERNSIYAYYKKKSMIIITPDEKIWIDTNEVLDKEDDTTHKALNSDNDQISSSVCCKENKKEPSTRRSVADFLVNAKKIEINFAAVMESSLKQNNDKNTIVSEIDQTKSEAIESDEIKTETMESDKIKTETIESYKIKTEAIKSDETKTKTIQSDETKTGTSKSIETKIEAVKSDDTTTEAVKSEETNTETIKSDKTNTEAVKSDETKTEAVKSVETKTETSKSNDTKIEAVKSDETTTETVKSEETKTEAVKLDETKIEAVQSVETKNETFKSVETKTGTFKSNETKTEDIKSKETKTEAVKSDENKTETSKSNDTKIEAVKSDETTTEAVKSEETKTEAVKLDETKTEAVKSVETKTGTFKSIETKTEAIKSDEAKTEAVKSDETKREAMESDQTKNEAVKLNQTSCLLKGELATVIYGLLFILLIGPKLITASCILKITSIELEPPDILLYVNASKDCDFKGVSKWEGGPDNTLLTFGNQSQHKNYQPVQRGRTFDLLIRNATQKEYNARYNFHLKFKNISAYLPTLPVYPGKGCFQTHCHVMGETLVVEVHVKAFPEPFFEILFASMNLTEKQEKKFTKKKLFYEGNVNFTYRLPEKSCDGQLNINYYLGAVHGNLFQKVINGCTKSGSYTEAIVVPIVSLLVIMVLAIGIFMCKKKCKEKCCTKNTEHQVGENDHSMAPILQIET